MTWLRFRLSATLLVGTYRQHSSLLGARAFVPGLSGRPVGAYRQQASMSAASASSGGTAAGGGGGGGNKGNRLAGETSPYLLQHAHNPVDWMPWGQEAFSRAKEEDKPIFLSVGYSTCHW